MKSPAKYVSIEGCQNEPTLIKQHQNKPLQKPNSYNFIKFCGLFISFQLIFVLFVLFYLNFTNNLILNYYNSFWIIIIYLGLIILLSFLCLYQQKGCFHFKKISKHKKFKINRNNQDFIVKSTFINENDILYLSKGDIVPVDVELTNSVKHVTYRNVINKSLVTCSNERRFIPSGSLIVTGTNNQFKVISTYSSSIYNNFRKQIKQFLSNQSYLYHKFPITNNLLKLNFYISILFSILFIIFLICLLQSKMLNWQFILRFSVEIIILAVFDRVVLICLLNSRLVQYFPTTSSVNYRDWESCMALSFVDTLIIVNSSDNTLNSNQTSLPTVEESLISNNRFCLSSIWIDGTIMEGDDLCVSEVEDQKTSYRHSPTWTALTRDCILCNDADMSPWTLERSPIERECYNYSYNDQQIFLDESLLANFNKCDSIRKWGGGSLPRYRENNRTLMGPRWNNVTGCKTSVHRLNDGDSRFLLVIQGDVKHVLSCCNTVMVKGKSQQLDPARHVEVMEACESMLDHCMVVRAFADSRLNPDDFPKSLEKWTSDQDSLLPKDGLRLIGLIGFGDSFKSNTELAIKQCQAAGINIIFTSPQSNSAEFRLLKKSNLPLCHIDLANSDNPKIDLTNQNLIYQISNLTNQKLAQLINKLQNKKNKFVGVISTPDYYSMVPMMTANISITPNLSKILEPAVHNYIDAIVSDNSLKTLVESRKESISYLKNYNTILSLLFYPKFVILFYYFLFVFFCDVLPINLSFLVILEICHLFPLLLLPLSNNDNNESKIQFSFCWFCSRFLLILEMGSIQLFGSIFSFFITMALHGFLPLSLLKNSHNWYSIMVNDFVDYYGQEWTYGQRRQLELEACTVVFATIIILQAFSILFSMTKAQSIFHYICKIKTLLIAALLSLVMAAYFVYIGSYFQFVEFTFLSYYSYLMILPFVIYLFVYFELKRFIMRRFNLTFCEW